MVAGGIGEGDGYGGYRGQLVEIGPTARIFTNPSRKATEDYVSGRFG